MGSLLSSAFIPPGDLLGCETTPTDTGEIVDCLAPFSTADWYWGMVQVLGMAAAYGYVLFTASNMLSDGSELLLLVPSISGIVGSVVLPILGAVPDGAIMLFSGLGPGAQEELAVGVGALAGSTIMLLTIPWGLSIILGRVDVTKPDAYRIRAARKKNSVVSAKDVMNKKLGHTSNPLTDTGVQPASSIKANASIMLTTAVTYLVIQGPAFKYALMPSDATVEGEVAKDQHWWSLGGLILSVAMFCWYLYLMIEQANPGHKAVLNATINERVLAELSSQSHPSISSIIAPLVAEARERVTSERASVLLESSSKSLDEHLLGPEKQLLETLLMPYFDKYARGDQRIDMGELRTLLNDLNEDVSSASWWMEKFDTDQSGYVEKGEFLNAMLSFMMTRLANPDEAEEDEDEGEEEDVEYAEDEHLTPEQRQTAIKMRAAKLMFIGLSLIIVFSDPMVDVMGNIGARCSIPPFYVSFVLAPLASNASELIASLNYARRKTKKTITVSLSALEGAACMNNTFCIAIFMGLIFFQGLAWKFTAETLATLLIEVLVFGVALQSTQTTLMGVFLLSLFPLSIAFIAGLEAFGFD